MWSRQRSGRQFPISLARLPRIHASCERQGFGSMQLRSYEIDRPAFRLGVVQDYEWGAISRRGAV